MLDKLDRRLVWKPLTDAYKLLHERMVVKPDAR